MKKLILITFFLGATNLFAQQIDSTLIQDFSELKKMVFQQQQEIEQFKASISEQQTRFDEQEETVRNLQRKVNNQQKSIGRQKENFDGLKRESETQKIEIDSLNQSVQNNSQNIVSNSNEFGLKIEQTGETVSANNSKITALDDSLSKNQLYWIIATLVILILGGLVYWLLGKRIQSSKTDVETQIRNTKASLEEESVKLDNKLLEVLETQLKLKQEESKSQPSISTEKADHSLALKVADEIVRMQKNLTQMDEKTKGLKQLNSSVLRIQDNFAANGYELVEMLGKEYNEGMKVIANFTPSEDLETGKQIISRIIKPQVNFKGEMIQAAQIEVSVGE